MHWFGNPRVCASHALRRLVGVVVVVIGAGTCELIAAPGTAAAPVTRFLSSLDADSSIPAEAAKLIRESWANCEDCDGDEFLTQGLTLLSPKFRAALDAYDEQRYDQCAEIMHDLRQSKNPFIAAHAAAYEIKAMIAQQRLLEAGQRIEDILAAKGGLRRVADYSYLAPEMLFLRGFCLLSDLRYAEAEKALSKFLKDHEDSSQRLVVAARQMLAELANRQAGRIGEVVDLMHYSGRRLTQSDTSDPVRDRQQEIIDILDRLIKDAEEEESSSSSSSSGGGGSGRGKQGSSGKNSPSNPMDESSLPGGTPAEGPLQAGRRVNPGEVWGSMPPAERERILQALRDNFPSRYRQLVEQYYEQLAKKP